LIIETDEANSCFKCDFETTIPLAECPRCGSRMLTAKHIRRLGWVLIATGIFLAAFMAVLIILIAGIVAQSDNPAATTRFSGTPFQAAMILGLLGLVLAFGLACIIAGVYQIRHGRRNKKLIRITLWLAFALLIIGIVIQAFV
jgi:MFS family permease